MKIATSSRVLASSLGLLSCSIATVEGFNSAHNLPTRRQNAATLTKLDATSFEEDLALTLKVIMDHQDRSVTVSKEQLIQQMGEAEKKSEEEKTDISVPYDAAARLAYNTLDDKESISFEEFEIQYLKDAVTMVKSKQPIKIEEPEDTVVDLAVPYDAAARLAYESFQDKQKVAFEAFEAQYLADAVALVKSKQPNQEAGDAPPLTSASADTTASADPVISETKPTINDDKPKTLLQPILNMLWKKVSSIGKEASKA